MSDTRRLSGARRPSDGAALQDLLADLLRLRLIEKGRAISVADAHVAQCALDRDAPLLSRDRAFATIARHAPLRLVRDT